MPQVLREAEEAGALCDSRGWSDRPSWAALAGGQRPPTPEPAELALGECSHGWQYHASNALEMTALDELKVILALPSRRSNAQATGKTRLRSCMGRFSPTWLTSCPTTAALTFRNDEMSALVKMRLGLAICADGPDAHGYYRLADGVGGRRHARHKTVIASWRQVLSEAGGEVPDWNVERLLARTHVPVPQDSLLRLDLVVPGLSVAGGLPFFCDVTVISPLTHGGRPRLGTSGAGGRLLAIAQNDNDNTYAAVTDSGLGSLYRLGFEVFGRWGKQCIELLPLLAREKSRGMHPRLRRGTASAYHHRWAGLVSVGLMKGVAAAAMRGEGSDLARTLLEPEPAVADLLPG